MARVRDRNRIPEALKQIARVNQLEARVGIFDDAPGLANIARLNEFGVDITVTAAFARKLRALADEHNAPTDGLPREGDVLRIPERSFVRSTADAQEDAVAQAMPTALARVMLGELDGYEALMEIAKMVQQAVIDRVASGQGLAPLDPFTIAVSGESRPLIGKKGVFETTQGIRVRVVRR